MAQELLQHDGDDGGVERVPAWLSDDSDGDGDDESLVATVSVAHDELGFGTQDHASGNGQASSGGNLDQQAMAEPPRGAGHGGPSHRGPAGPFVVRVAAFVAALGGVLFGYDIGVVAAALLQLEDDFELTNFQKELVVSVMLLGAMVASICGGVVLDSVGRRDGIIGNAVVFVVGGLMLAFAPNLTVLLLGRFVVGFGVSLSAVAECVYISEIAPADSRGWLVSLNEFGISVGLVLSYLVGFALIHSPSGWRLMFGMSVPLAAIQGLAMFFLPKSPRWLMLQGKVPEARNVLLRLRESAQQVDDEMRTIRSDVGRSTVTLLGLVRKPELRRALVLSSALSILQQFTGNANVLFYGATVFKQAGFKSDAQATLSQVFLGIGKVLATVFAIYAVDRLGRRKLLLWGTALMGFCLAALATVTTVEPPEKTPAINGTVKKSTCSGVKLFGSAILSKRYQARQSCLSPGLGHPFRKPTTLCLVAPRSRQCRCFL
eukprot:m.360435 g.360435  ORF g.360435 m.360435 type:complete len:489 (+) comp19955_c0_seq7:220-1686(+)